jgi:hypothetical protein
MLTAVAMEGRDLAHVLARTRGGELAGLAELDAQIEAAIAAHYVPDGAEEGPQSAGERPGGVRSLGEILGALEGRLPTAGWRAHLQNLLSDPLGLNLRNVIAHGLRGEIGREDAALLIHAACFLRLLEPQTRVVS